MKRIVLIGLMVASSAFAAKPKPAVEDSAKVRAAALIEAAKELARNNLNDPESARFRDVFLSPRGAVVCGEINAKNRVGGYVGFRRFLAVGSSVYYDDSESSFVAKSWDSECADQGAKR